MKIQPLQLYDCHWYPKCLDKNKNILLIKQLSVHPTFGQTILKLAPNMISNCHIKVCRLCCPQAWKVVGQLFTMLTSTLTGKKRKKQRNS